MHAFRILLTLIGPLFAQIAIHLQSPDEVLGLHAYTLDAARHWVPSLPSLASSLFTAQIWVSPLHPQLAEPFQAQSPSPSLAPSPSPAPAPAASPSPAPAPAAEPAVVSSSNDVKAQLSELSRLQALIDSGALIRRDSCPPSIDAAAANGHRDQSTVLSVALLLSCLLVVAIKAYGKAGDNQAGVPFLARLTDVFRGPKTADNHDPPTPRVAEVARPRTPTAHDSHASSTDHIVLADGAFCGLADGWSALTLDERVWILSQLREHARPPVQQHFQGDFPRATESLHIPNSHAATEAHTSFYQLQQVWDLLSDDHQTAVIQFFLSHVPQEMPKTGRCSREVLDDPDLDALKRYMAGVAGGWESLPRMRRVHIFHCLRRLSLPATRNYVLVDGSFRRSMVTESAIVPDREAVVRAELGVKRLEEIWGSLGWEVQVELLSFLHRGARHGGTWGMGR
ncbi:hypothetical protein FB45DRAFT_169016 [Roridomyces roridus]|uniref:Uncharacterized protein n=1 Tax=Roridomyces roridus TaxID=1738132 RepID=A0AAD7BE71_9AGAR|nr:hypothetical protein FB45DRAFT_169016 [Roridomyces roridus]